MITKFPIEQEVLFTILGFALGSSLVEKYSAVCKGVFFVGIHGAIGCGTKTFTPTVPVQVPSQRPLALSVTSVANGAIL